MAASDRYPPARGDEAELFRDFNDELMRLIGHAVHHCTPQIIEDACSFAWAEFLRHQPDRGHNWRGWIFRTAQRQAWVLAREARDALPLISSDGSDQRGVRGAETIDELELRRDVTDALSVLAQIPPRMQRIALLRALGMRHREIAEITGDSPTSVHRLIVTANERIADVLEARAHAERPSAPRAERLWELERHPPEWLVRRIGRPATAKRRARGLNERRRAWRRAALALDDYRHAAGPERFGSMTNQPPAEPALRGPHASAVKALEEFETTRCGDRARGHER